MLGQRALWLTMLMLTAAELSSGLEHLSSTGPQHPTQPNSTVKLLGAMRRVISSPSDPEDPPKGDCAQVQYQMESCSNLVTSLTSQVVGTTIKKADKIKCHYLSLPERCRFLKCEKLRTGAGAHNSTTKKPATQYF